MLFITGLMIIIVGIILSNTETYDKSDKLSIVATTTQITDLVSIIGGDVVEVKGLMGSGIDPHSYQATESDVRSLQQADIIIYNGLHLEGKMTDLLANMAKQKIPTYAISDAVLNSKLMAGEDDYEGSYDPHIWFDANLWLEVITYVSNILIEHDPKNKDIYVINTEKYLEEVREVHEFVYNKAMEIPPQKRVLITAHDAFQYFGRAYEFIVLGIEGLSPESEVGIADIRKLADYIVQNEIKAIFVETSVSTRNAKALQQAVKARGFDVNIGGDLYSDAMGEKGKDEGTYIGMMKYNITTIVQALK